MPIGLSHALITGILAALAVAAMQHFHFMANATRLKRTLALAIVVFVVVTAFSAIWPGAAAS